MSITANKILSQKKAELSKIEALIKQSKSICFKILNKTTEYKASNGRTLKEMEEELKSIKKALGIDENDEETDPIEVFKYKISKKEKRIEKYKAEIGNLREQIQAYNDKIEEISAKIPKKVKEEEIHEPIVDTTSDEVLIEDAKKTAKESLLPYKEELEKLKGDIFNFKAGFKIYMKNAFESIRNEMDKKVKAATDELNKQKQKIASLSETKTKLQKEFDDYQNKFNSFEGFHEESTIEFDPAQVRKDTNNMYKMFFNHVKNASTKFNITSDKYIGKIFSKIKGLEGQIARLKAKVDNCASSISHEKSQGKAVTKQQANLLMQTFLQSVFMKKKMESILGKLEPKLKEQADKFDKQLKEEEALGGKVVFENYTISDLRKWIIKMIKENAKLNLEMEDFGKVMNGKLEALKKFAEEKMAEADK